MPPAPMRSMMRYSPLSTSAPIRESVTAAMVDEPPRFARSSARGRLRAYPRPDNRSAKMAVGAYRYEAWPRIGRADAELLRGALRALPRATPALLAEAEALLGAPAELLQQAGEIWAARDAVAALPP